MSAGAVRGEDVCPHCQRGPGLASGRRSGSRNARVLELVADACGVSLVAMLSPDVRGRLDRHKTTAHARMIAIYVLRTAYAMSLPEIARAVGAADHTTAMYGVRRIGDLLSVGPLPEEERLALRDLCDRLVGEARRWTSDGAEIAKLAKTIPYRLANAGDDEGLRASAGGGHG